MMQNIEDKRTRGEDEKNYYKRVLMTLIIIL